MRRFVFLASLLVPLHALPAQDPVLHPEKERVQKEILRKQEAIREGKVGLYNVRVRLRLNNGSRMLGVVKSGRFVEQEHGIDFVEADRHSSDAGIRLWYFDDSNSFVFLRWADIESHKVVARLTNEEVRAIETSLVERDAGLAEQRRLAAERKAKAEAAARAEAERAAAPTPGGEPATPATPATPSPIPDLLREFPPDQGWGEARAAEIEQRKIAVGAYPNPQERRFLEVLPDWKLQRDEYAARAQKADKPAGGDTGKPGATTEPATSPAPKPSDTPAPVKR